jgi:hypothetical protein
LTEGRSRPANPSRSCRSLKARLDEVVAAVSSDHHEDKPYEGINVFISEGANRWLYCGRCRIVYDGRHDDDAQTLPIGPSHEGSWPPLLRTAFISHATHNKQSKARNRLRWRQRVLSDWNFRTAQNLAAADKELEATRAGDNPERLVRYLVLACDGFDEDSLAVWKGKKLKGKRKSGGSGRANVKKKRSANGKDGDGTAAATGGTGSTRRSTRSTRSSASLVQ